MSEPKFTKRPWKVVDNGYFLQISYPWENNPNVIDHYCRSVADIYSNDIANANLIAAAPDMYEALKAYEKAEADIVLNANWYTESGVPQITQEQFDMLIDCQTLRNIALRKARGEEE